MDEPSVADVHADVADAVEEDEVAGAKRRAGDPDAQVVVAVAAVRKVAAEAGVDEADETGAVEPGCRRRRLPSGREHRGSCARTARRGPRPARRVVARGSGAA